MQEGDGMFSKDRKGNTIFNLSKLQLGLATVAMVCGVYLGMLKGIDIIIRPVIQDEIGIASQHMKKEVEDIHGEYVKKIDFIAWAAVKDAKLEEQERTNNRMEEALKRIEEAQLEILKRLPR